MKNQLSTEAKNQLISILRERFESNMYRHPNISWNDVNSRLEENPESLYSLQMMEDTGGEPDVISLEKDNDQIVFIDCSKESPSGRRSLCYDREALDARKKFKPENSAKEVAKFIGVEILNEKQYRYLQSIESVDSKTSSWLDTPNEIRTLGGAIFGDFRYKQVFIYHNGADSYYAARGFRGRLQI